jgi:hypothetical protein
MGTLHIYSSLMMLIVRTKYMIFNFIEQACGVDLGIDKFPNIYFASIEPEYLYRSVCVSECPMLTDEDSESDETL